MEFTGSDSKKSVIAKQTFGFLRQLPAGPLREPPTSVRRPTTLSIKPVASFVLLSVFIVLCPSVGRAAGTWTPFGPVTYVRGPGTVTETTATFRVMNPNAIYALEIKNGGLSGQFARTTGTITLNSTQVVGPLALNPLIPVLVIPVRLLSTNQLTINLRGAAGSGLALDIVGVDIGPPSITGTVSPAPNSVGWNNSDVTVSFTCSDKTSGVASCPLPVLVSNEGAHQVISGTVTDNAGNKASTSVIVNLDKTPPVISGVINPPPNPLGWNTSAVTVSFSCLDSLSGIASCTSPVGVVTQGLGQIVTGTATDRAGNKATVQTTVNISTSIFSIRNYEGKCLDFGPPPLVAGAPVYISNCNGSAEQQVLVQEVNSNHDVLLHAGNFVISYAGSTSGGSSGTPPILSAASVAPNSNSPAFAGQTGILTSTGTPAATTGPPPVPFGLQLQVLINAATTLAASQYFDLDGDSIIVTTNRNLVVQLPNAVNLNHTQLIVGSRNLADAEFWDFNAIDGSDKDPTSGFVRVGYPGDPETPLCKLLRYIPLFTPANAPPNPCFPGGTPSPAGPGTVLKVYAGASIDLSGVEPLQIAQYQSGVTIRGDRRGTLYGPCLHKEVACDDYSSTPNVPNDSMLEIKGNDVRITGLRLQGSSRSSDQNQTGSIGVLAHDGTLEQYLRSIIDHNDISGFTEQGVRVAGNDDTSINGPNAVCDPNDNPFTRTQNVVVTRNFIHHNREQDAGYGVESNSGAFPLVESNTFLYNRHAIAAGYGTSHTAYRAWFNLVLSEAPLQTGAGPFDTYEHDFDMHGLGTGTGLCETCNGYGILGGDYVEIYENTFLGTNRQNYQLRAEPCHNTDYHFNISLQSEDDSLLFKDSNLQDPASHRIEYMNVSTDPNQFSFSNPTNQVAVGDFDGDGVQDTFLATGTAWYYAPQGNAEWRFLNSGKTDMVGTLLFGDFDGDGRTDVVGINGNNLMVSWGGVSDWEVLNTLPSGATIADLAVGNFVDDFSGDRRADIFYSDGTSWYVSSGGSGPFTFAQTSSFRVKDLRFGDFDGDGHTDVFSVGNTGWQVSYSPGSLPFSEWKPLPVSLTNTVTGLVVADFDGDGRADIALPSSNLDSNISGSFPNFILSITGWGWNFSHDGVQSWTSHQITPTDSCALTFGQTQLSGSGLMVGIGQFDGTSGADILIWGSSSEQDDYGNNFCIVSGGTGAAQRQSRQDMR